MSATGRTEASSFEVIVMVASLGGLQSVSAVLGGLPRTFAVPVLVSQHGKQRTRPDVLPALLQRETPLPVQIGRHGLAIEPGTITVVPRGCATTLDAGYRLNVTASDHIGQGDALLASAAEVAGPRAIGVVLTGTLHDGSEGVRAIKRRGGRVLVEDPATARAAGMPSNAIATGCVDFVLPARRIAAALVALTMAPGGAELLAVPTPAWASLHPNAV